MILRDISRCNRGKRRSRLKICTIVVLLIPGFIYFGINYFWPVMHVFRNKDIMSPCVLPKYDAYDQSIANFFWQSDPIKCGAWPDLVFVDSDGILRINSTAVTISGQEKVKCGHRALSIKDDKIIEFAPEFTYNLPAYVPYEFFRVHCKDINDNVIYDYMHYNINWTKGNNDKQFGEESVDQLSVHIFGIDSVSMLIAKRKLKKTMKYLREELGAYMMDGYTKVADNTYPNIVAFLSGRKAYTNEMVNYTLDKFPFIWKDFGSNGYVNLYAEDCIKITTFVGFNKKPTDHYLRPYYVAIDEMTSKMESTLHNAILFLDHHKVNLNLNDISPLCHGNTPKHVRHIQYLRDFMHHYDKKLKFSFSWLTELTHDFINFVELLDKDALDFFKWMKESGKLDNSVLILFSDHGPRYSEIQNTPVGRVTDLMPLLAIVFPKHIREKYPHIHRNLITNANRLTTHYDMYETLKDILYRRFEKRETLNGISELPRGISLFQEVPERRSCFDADIPEVYCPCYQHKNVSIKDDRIRKIAHFVVDKINKMLERFSPKCASLQLSSIDSAAQIISNFQRASDAEEYFSFRSFLYRNVVENSKYLVVLKAKPCGGTFEGTVEIKQDGSIKVLENINRINRYGNQSSCIEDKIMRLYCCCRS